MNPAEFANIRAVEQDFWWYRGMRKIFFRMLDPLLRGRRLERVLEAIGRETGLTTRVLQWQPKLDWHTQVRPDALIEIDVRPQSSTR